MSNIHRLRRCSRSCTKLPCRRQKKSPVALVARRYKTIPLDDSFELGTLNRRFSWEVKSGSSEHPMHSPQYLVAEAKELSVARLSIYIYCAFVSGGGLVNSGGRFGSTRAIATQSQAPSSFNEDLDSREVAADVPQP